MGAKWPISPCGGPPATITVAATAASNMGHLHKRPRGPPSSILPTRPPPHAAGEGWSVIHARGLPVGCRGDAAHSASMQCGQLVVQEFRCEILSVEPRDRSQPVVDVELRKAGAV